MIFALNNDPEESEEEDDLRDDDVDDKFGNCCDFPIFELPTGELNRSEI